MDYITAYIRAMDPIGKGYHWETWETQEKEAKEQAGNYCNRFRKLKGTNLIVNLFKQLLKLYKSNSPACQMLQLVVTVFSLCRLHTSVPDSQTCLKQSFQQYLLFELVYINNTIFHFRSWSLIE